MSSLDVCRPAEVVGEVRRRYTLQTLVNEKGEFIVNPLRYFEPVQLAEERGDVVEPRDRDVDNFSRDETETRRWYVSRPSRDRDVDTETTTLLNAQLTTSVLTRLWVLAVTN